MDCTAPALPPFELGLFPSSPTPSSYPTSSKGKTLGGAQLCLRGTTFAQAEGLSPLPYSLLGKVFSPKPCKA